LARLVLGAARLLSPDEFELYPASEGALTLDVGSPLAVYIGSDFTREWTVPQRAFLAGRAAFGLAFRTALFRRTSPAELADLIGNSIRIFAPGFGLLGRRNDDMSKQLRKIFSRRALKALEAACTTSAKSVDLPATVEGLRLSADRFGAVISGDPSAAVEVLAREESLYSGDNLSLADAVDKSASLRKLLLFCLTDTYFELRAKANTGLTELPSRRAPDLA
jgi:hypothetical protein